MVQNIMIMCKVFISALVYHLVLYKETKTQYKLFQCVLNSFKVTLIKHCVSVCPDGHYGDKCEKTCGIDAKCNHVTGECCGCTELRTLGILILLSYLILMKYQVFRKT